MFLTILWIFVTTALSYVAYLYCGYKRTLSSIGNFPGLRQTVYAIPTIQSFYDIAAGREVLPKEKFKPFQAAGWDAISWVRMWPQVGLAWVLADPDAIKEVVSDRARFAKPVRMYQSLSIFGGNIIASEGETPTIEVVRPAEILRCLLGEEWKRHRKIVAPAFTERNSRLVWDEATRIVDDLLDNVWLDGDKIMVDDVKDITLTVALLVINAAGFGENSSWLDSRVPPAGHQLSFRDTVHTMCDSLVFILTVPRWAMGIRESWRAARTSADEMHKYMHEMIAERRHSLDDASRNDLFSLLMSAHEDIDIPATEKELMGNIFVFLLAGHETTANTLAFALAHLALYPETQDRLFEEVRNIMKKSNGNPTWEDFDALPYTMAVVYETLRMQPPIVEIPKYSTQDTTLPVTNQRGEKTVIPVPEGTYILLDAMGLHYNPRLWDDPSAFKPERFLGKWNRDAFVPFSSGARSCIGRRFSETEAVAVLSRIIARYKVQITNEAVHAGETFQQKSERVLAYTKGVTTTPARVPLTFVRRI